MTQYPMQNCSGTCCGRRRPNSVVVTYGYGFGDDHVNRSHRYADDTVNALGHHQLWTDARLKSFCANTRDAQVTLLVDLTLRTSPRWSSTTFLKPARSHHQPNDGAAAAPAPEIPAAVPWWKPT